MKRGVEEDKALIQAGLRSGQDIISFAGMGSRILQKLRKAEKEIDGNLFLVYTTKEYKYQLATVGPGIEEGQYRPLWPACFYLQRMPGCCGLMVFHNFYVQPPSYTRNGLGTLINMIAQWRAYSEGYTRLMATDVPHVNVYSDKIFKDNGWEVGCPDFNNRRTTNAVRSYYKDHLSDILNDKSRLQANKPQEGA